MSAIRQSLATLLQSLFLKYGVPVGSISAFPTDGAIPGYLLCDGTVYDMALYPKLAAMLSNFKKPSTASTAFNVPDFRGYYLRGADKNTNLIDTSMVFDITTSATTTLTNKPGLVLQDLHKSHSHSVQDAGHTHNFTYSFDAESPLAVQSTSVSPVYADSRTSGAQPTKTEVTANSKTGIVIANSGFSETRPKSILVNYYIKHD